MGHARLQGNLVGAVIGCQVSYFATAMWLVHCLQEESFQAASVLIRLPIYIRGS